MITPLLLIFFTCPQLFASNFADLPRTLVENEILPKLAVISMRDYLNACLVSPKGHECIRSFDPYKIFKMNLEHFYKVWGINTQLDLSDSFNPHQDIKDLIQLRKDARDRRRYPVGDEDVYYAEQEFGSFATNKYSSYTIKFQYEKLKLDVTVQQKTRDQGPGISSSVSLSCNHEDDGPNLRYGIIMRWPKDLSHPEFKDRFVSETLKGRFPGPGVKGYRLIAVIFQIMPSGELRGKCAGVFHIFPFLIGPRNDPLKYKT